MTIRQNFGLTEIIKPLQKYSSTQVKLPAGSQFKLGSIWWVLSSDLYYTTSSPAANTLYAVYAYNNSGVIALTASTTMPSAIGSGYKLVGAYHTDGSSLVGCAVNPWSPTLTDWLPYTATFFPEASGSFTPSTMIVYYRLVGTSIEMEAGEFTVSSVSSPVGAPCMTIPTGFAVERSYFRTVFGNMYDASAAAVIPTRVYVGGGNFIKMANTSAVAVPTIAAGDLFNFGWFTFDISGDSNLSVSEL